MQGVKGFFKYIRDIFSIQPNIEDRAFCKNTTVAEAYSEACRTSKMELFTKMINYCKPLDLMQLTIFAEGCILDVLEGSEYD